jgi:serine protease Do
MLLAGWLVLALAGPSAWAGPQDKEVARALSNAFAEAAQEVLPSVVTITSLKMVRFSSSDPFERFFGEPFFWPFPSPHGRSIPQRGLGSGVIVRDDGIILTNNHVVEDAEEISVLLADGRRFEAEIVGRDPKTDLAVIRIKADEKDLEDLPVATLGDSDALRVGDWVIAVGSPFQLSQTVTAGIVSAKGRSNLRLASYENFIQTDAAINPGNSGGALVDLEGRVVGINTAIVSRTGAYQGIGFAIPINMARSVMESILQYGRVIRGYLGVYIQDVTQEMAKALDMDEPHGALVSQVTEDGPADKAGVKDGDVILEVDGEPVKDSQDLRFRIAATPPGTEVELTVLRDGKRKTIKVELGELPEEEMAEAPAGGGRDWEEKLGLELTRLTSRIRRELDLPDDVKGAVVESVEPGSPADEAGFRRGDVITEADRQPVDSPGDFWDILDEVPAGETILVRVFREEARLFLPLTIPE